MKLKKVRIQNFKSITDTSEFTVENITCLVGKNESGKTAILQALSKLDPIAGQASNEALFDELDFPRMSFSDYSDDDRPNDVLTTTWELEAADIAALETILGEGNLLSNTVTASKGYSNKIDWQIQIDYKSIVKQLIDDSNLYAEESAALSRIILTRECGQQVP